MRLYFRFTLSLRDIEEFLDQGHVEFGRLRAVIAPADLLMPLTDVEILEARQVRDVDSLSLGAIRLGVEGRVR